MKKLLMSLLLASMSTYAFFPLTDVENFEGSFNDPIGSATADSFNIPDYQLGTHVEFSVERQAGIYILQTPVEEIQLDQLPELVYQMMDLDWNGAYLSSDQNEFQIGLTTLNGVHTTGSLKLNELHLTCLSSGIITDLMDEVLDSCLNNESSFSLDYLSLTQEGETSTLENLQFDISGDNLGFKIKAQGFTVKGKGEVYYQPGLVKIKITKAKAGIFSVKSKLFKELKALESENISVNNPWIEIAY